jgi:AraC-like DNA-binding protein
MDREWGAFVTDAGFTRIGPNSPYPPARHPEGYHFDWERGRVLQEFQVVYIPRGKGVFESEATGRREVPAGSVYLLFPGVWHRYAPEKETGWDEYWAGFDGEIPRRLLKKGFLTPQTALVEFGEDESLLEIFLQLIELVRADAVGSQQIGGALVLQILARLHAFGLLRKAGPEEADPIIRRAKCLLLENVDRSVSMEEIARELHVGYSRFRHMFRYGTGLSPAQYHLQLRIKRAAQLLEGSPLSVKEVAGRTGFDSASYFSRLFRKKMGLSPEQWRQGRRAGALPLEAE